VSEETAQGSLQGQIERDFRHNALAHLLDGAFFWFAMSFIATNTIVPLWISNLTDSTLLIGLGPALHVGGWYLPQLFTANWVQRLERKRVAPVNVGFFTERLPLMLIAPAALLAVRSEMLALIAFFFLYAWASVGAGVVAVGWQDLFAKTIPRDRRARLFGLTNFVGMGGGILTAIAAGRLLQSYAFPYGYVLCFAAAGILLMVSWAGLALVREPPSPVTGPRISLRQYWASLPAVLRAHPNFGRFLTSQAAIRLGGMATGFLAVYAVQKWDLPDEQAAVYTMAMLVGQAVSNLPFGFVGDRNGQKLVYELSEIIWLVALVLALVAPSPAWFYVVFVLAGISFSGSYQSGVMIGLEFSSPEERPTFIGLNSTVSGLAAGVAPLLGGWLASQLGYEALFIVAFGMTAAGLASLHWLVTEPRQQPEGATP
jgi:MFS family permease